MEIFKFSINTNLFDRTHIFEYCIAPVSNLNHTQSTLSSMYKENNYNIHLDNKQTRSISISEAARYHSFTDDYYFEGEKEGANRTAGFNQIGNAVTPLIAAALAKTISRLMNGK